MRCNEKIEERDRDTQIKREKDYSMDRESGIDRNRETEKGDIGETT